jgi:hypothetical protein
MDEFPEAFKRFEKDNPTREINSYTQLQFQMMNWAGSRYIASNKQERALKIEAVKRGIPLEGKRTEYREPTRMEKMGIISTKFTRAGKEQTRYRDLKSGKFVRKTE